MLTQVLRSGSAAWMTHFWRLSIVDLMLLPWNFSIGCLHLNFCVSYVKLWGYIKRTLKENKVKQQVCLDYNPLQDCSHKNNSLVPSALHLPAASQYCVFLPANIYQSRPAVLHVPASTLTAVDLTRPCCHTLQGQIVPLAHCDLYTSLLLCFIDLRYFLSFK